MVNVINIANFNEEFDLLHHYLATRELNDNETRLVLERYVDFLRTNQLLTIAAHRFLKKEVPEE